jgi:hypothetical protein
MRNIFYFTLMLFVAIAAMPEQGYSQPLAFPGAEGHGAYTTGGRGGQVIEVTNLNNSGSGSLRAAVDASGSRTVVFRVSGTIELKSELTIKNNSITIAGQTAPGDGICISNYSLKVDADNVIIRFIRSRMGDNYGYESDAMWGRRKQYIIIDHCSMSWSIDEAASFYDNENFTMQWCIISESLWNSVHDKGQHGYGGIWGGKKASFHHNLLAHHTSRNPRFNGARYHGEPDKEIMDFRNNVIYNWGSNSAYGGDGGGSYNIVNNYYKSGPATSKKDRIVQPWGNITKWYINGNHVEGYEGISNNNWAGGVHPSQGAVLFDIKSDVEFETGSIVTQSAEQAFESVMEHAGCFLPIRDAIDVRIVDETRNGTATYGGSYGAGSGIIDTQNEVGGWPTLESTEAPLDSDHDGMPDEWEDANGFDKNNSDDRNELLEDGTTVLELYLNSLVEGFNYPQTSARSIKLVSDVNIYPNPVNGVANLQFNMEGASKTTFSLIDLSGKVVRNLGVNRTQAGYNSMQFDVSGVQSGIYLLKIDTEDKPILKKMIISQ